MISFTTVFVRLYQNEDVEVNTNTKQMEEKLVLLQKHKTDGRKVL